MKFIGYDYREKPSPHRVPVFVIEEDEEVTLEDLKEGEKNGF